MTVEELLARTKPNGECMEWQGARTRAGYGVLRIKGSDNKIATAHRTMYQLLHGVTLGRWEVIRHKCDNPPCIAPDHLDVGSQGDNGMDRGRRGRVAHALLNEQQAREAKARLACGDRPVDIARSLGVDANVIQRIKIGRTYRWVS